MALSAAGLLACASPASNNGGQGGSGSGQGGSKATGGSTGSGGSNSPGSGGSNSTGSGGSNSTGSGGTLSTGNGGSNTGSGGSHTGGTTGSGGSNTTGSGGSNTTGSGGSNTTGVGGSNSTGTGGAPSNGTNPPGYYSTKSDWGVTSVDWHGCVWTGIDSTVTGSTTSITPRDFTAATKEGGPYEVSGTVYNDYNAVAMIGFNINEAASSDATQCKYNAAAATQAGPPAGTIPSSATGIAVSWSAKTAPPTSFRIQIQAADATTNTAHIWCATITDAQGPSFVPFSSFNTKCWDGTGSKYNNEAIDAVVFLVPGTVAQKAPFDFTITGFAPGTSKSDAPGGGTVTCGNTTGTLGSTTASMDASYQRAKVTGKDCKQYIIQNNNWGSPTGSTQVINYTGTGFTVKSSSGSGSSAPASFPSTYVGANGNIASGTYSTWADTGLPKQIKSITSAMTSFGWTGSSGDFNATYDVWFAKTAPTAGSYNDGISGFIMVWYYKPSSRQPIGKVVRTASIAGHTWDVWVGPRGNTSSGTDPSGRPVVSYVAKDSPVMSLSFDLKAFMNDAVTNAAADETAGGTSQPFSSDWYLTDVFAGFEIWGGSSATNLTSTGFTFALQ